LFRQIQLVKPRVILTLGQTAARAILGPEKWPGMVEMRGKWQAALDAAVMPTFHPAYLFRVSSARAAFEEDFRAVAERLTAST
jgi:DNA polymerase